MLLFVNGIQCIQLQRSALARAATRVELTLLKGENTILHAKIYMTL